MERDHDSNYVTSLLKAPSSNGPTTSQYCYSRPLPDGPNYRMYQFTFKFILFNIVCIYAVQPFMWKSGQLCGLHSPLTFIWVLSLHHRVASDFYPWSHLSFYSYSSFMSYVYLQWPLNNEKIEVCED